MTFTYTTREMKKIRITQKFIDRVLSLTQALDALGVSERTLYRYKATLQAEWPPGFIHGLKWKPSNHDPNTSKFASIDQIIKKSKFLWFGPTLLAEKLDEIYNITIDHETLRRRMIKKWLRVCNQRKVKIQRERRERRAQYGMLIQFDGSYHDRLENGEKMCLLCAIDDATSKDVQMQFTQSERMEDIFEFWKKYFENHGKPEAIYLDCHASYKVNHPQDQFTKEMKTRFQRAMEKLWVIVIYSKEPEGKWRVERWFGTHQDRLIKEMRLAHITDYADANKFLEEYYIPKHNQKFSIPAKEEWDCHKKTSQQEINDLERFFSYEIQRVIRRDGTVSYKNITYQVQKWQLLRQGKIVTVKESMYWNIKLYSSDLELQFVRLYSR